MRKLTLFALVLVCAAGCGKKAPALKNNLGKSANGLGAIGSDPQTGQTFNTVAAEPAYEGRSVSVWAADLNREDQATRAEAGRALSKLGENAYPHLRDGLQSRSEAVRLTSIRSLPQTVMMAHQNETTPIMMNLVRDNSAEVRREAVVRLGWYGKGGQDFLPMLRGIMQRDADPKVRQAAMVTIDSIEQAVTGIIKVNPK